MVLTSRFLKQRASETASAVNAFSPGVLLKLSLGLRVFPIRVVSLSPVTHSFSCHEILNLCDRSVLQGS